MFWNKDTSGIRSASLAPSETFIGCAEGTKTTSSFSFRGTLLLYKTNVIYWKKKIICIHNRISLQKYIYLNIYYAISKYIFLTYFLLYKYFHVKSPVFLSNRAHWKKFNYTKFTEKKLSHILFIAHTFSLYIFSDLPSDFSPLCLHANVFSKVSPECFGTSTLFPQARIHRRAKGHVEMPPKCPH